MPEVTDREFDMLRGQVNALESRVTQSDSGASIAVMAEQIKNMEGAFSAHEASHDKQSNRIRNLVVVVALQVLAIIGQYVFHVKG